jgi:hypothetical protein
MRLHQDYSDSTRFATSQRALLPSPPGMSPSFAQYRGAYIFLFIALFGATVWTACYLFGAHYEVLPVGGIGYYRPRPIEEPKQQPWVGFHYSHSTIDVVVARLFRTQRPCSNPRLLFKGCTFLPCSTLMTLITHIEKPPRQRGVAGPGYLRG